MENNQGVAIHIEFSEIVEKAKEVNEWRRRGVHEYHGEYNDVQRIVVPVPERVIRAVLTLVPHFSILQIGDIGVKDLTKDVSHFEQTGEGSKGDLIDNITVVKKSVRPFVDDAEELQPSPASFKHID